MGHHILKFYTLNYINNAINIHLISQKFFSLFKSKQDENISLTNKENLRYYFDLTNKLNIYIILA